MKTSSKTANLAGRAGSKPACGSLHGAVRYSLQEIARRKPVDINVLMGHKRLWTQKVELYSASILTLVREHVDTKFY